VAVPTPVDDAHQPDFSPLVGSSKAVGQISNRVQSSFMNRRSIPARPKKSAFRFSSVRSGQNLEEGFLRWYSPERINPGDKDVPSPKIVKGRFRRHAGTLATVKEIYGSIITAGVYPASNIKVAEAAKVIRNTQRGPEYCLDERTCHSSSTRSALTHWKSCRLPVPSWKFPAFPSRVWRRPLYRCRPLLPDAQRPKTRLPPRSHPRRPAASTTAWGKLFAEQTIKATGAQWPSGQDCPIIVLGLTFKEDCPDLRNSRVIDVIRELESYGAKVVVHDPVADVIEARHEYGVDLVAWDDLPKVGANQLLP